MLMAKLVEPLSSITHRLLSSSATSSAVSRRILRVAVGNTKQEGSCLVPTIRLKVADPRRLGFQSYAREVLEPGFRKPALPFLPPRSLAGTHTSASRDRPICHPLGSLGEQNHLRASLAALSNTGPVLGEASFFTRRVSQDASTMAKMQPPRNAVTPTMSAAVAASPSAADCPPSPILTRIRKFLRLDTNDRVVYFAHLASLFGLLALTQKDMLWLRTFLVCGSLMGIAFNMLQPRPVVVPAMWGLVFVFLNVVQIGFLIEERMPVDLKPEEADIYELVFQKHGVTSHQFFTLMRSPGLKWLDLPPGHVIIKEGEPVNYVSVIVSGRAEVSQNRKVCGSVQRGCLVGETALLAKGHVARHQITTIEPTRIAQWPRHELRRLIVDDQNLLLSTTKVINNDLAQKLASSNETNNKLNAFTTYKEVLKGVCADFVITPEEKRALREFRKRHSISPAQHLEALVECQWTPEEYEDGGKRDSSMHFAIKTSINSFNSHIQRLFESATGTWTPKKPEFEDEDAGDEQPVDVKKKQAPPGQSCG